MRALASLRNSSLSSLLIRWTTFLAHHRKCHWHEMVHCRISSPSTFPTAFLFAPFSSAMIILGFLMYCGSFFTSRKMSRKFWRNIVTFSVSSVRHSIEANLCVFFNYGIFYPQCQGYIVLYTGVKPIHEHNTFCQCCFFIPGVHLKCSFSR